MPSEIALEEGIIYVGFNVEADGSLSEVRVVKGLCPLCDQMAVDLIKNGPEWLPAERNGEAFKAPMVVPITFAIKEISAPDHSDDLLPDSTVSN